MDGSSSFKLTFQCRYLATAVEDLVVDVNTPPPPLPCGSARHPENGAAACQWGVYHLKGVLMVSLLDYLILLPWKCWHGVLDATKGGKFGILSGLDDWLGWGMI